jgi:hypothetical protein
MRHKIASKSKHLAVVLMFTTLVPAAFAGPPLICHPFDIGDAKSLPWGGSSGTGDWNQTKSDYETVRLSADTLALLGERSPVIARMETIRRAALYAAAKDADTEKLLSCIKARAGENEGGKPNALYLFDYGYLVETLKQAWVTRHTKESINPVAAFEGLPYIQEALKLRGNDSQMEFAAAIVTSWPKNPSHADHLRKALAGAGQDPLLAKNLAMHFQDTHPLAAKAH